MSSKLLIWLFFLAIFIFFLDPFYGNADFYHHVNTGRYIIEHKSLSYFDDFSHTANGLPWVAHSWASGLIFYLILHSAGEVGISLFIASLALLTFVLFYELLKSYGVSTKISLLSLALAAPLIAQRFPQRPEAFSYPIVTSLLLVNNFSEKCKRLPLLFPVLILLWANLYGGASLLGLILLIVFALKQFISDGYKLLPERMIFYFSCAVSLPTSLINGYGLKSIFYFYFFIPKVAKYEGEWAGVYGILRYFPLNYLIEFQYQILIYLIFLILFVVVLILGLRKAISNKFFLFLSPAVFVPIFALRHIPMAVILSLPAFAKTLDQQTGFKKKILLSLTFVITIFLILLSLWANPPKLIEEPNFSHKNFINFIRDNNLRGRAFNHTHLGSLITYHFYPNILVFYDTRDELYLPTEALRDLQGLYSSSQSVIPVLKKYKIDLVIGDLITDGLSYRDLFYSKDWAIVFLDDKYFIALPRKVAEDKQIPALDFLDPYSITGAKNGFEEKGVEYFGSLNPKSFNNQALLAGSLIFLNRHSEAINILLNLSVGSGPNKAMFAKDKDYLLALIYLKKGECSQARIYLDQLSKEIRGIVIFDAGKQLPSSVNKGYAFYYLNCERNLNQAKHYLNLYLTQTDITPLEKLKTQSEFEKGKLD